MKRSISSAVLATILLALGVMFSACAASDTVGTSRESVTALESGVLFYDPLYSARPLSAEDIGDTKGTIEVRLELTGDHVVAWRANAGALRFTRDSFVAAWPADLGIAISNTVRVDDFRTGVTAPGLGRTSVDTITGRGVQGPSALTERPREVGVQWSLPRGLDVRVLRDIQAYHPGCL